MSLTQKFDLLIYEMFFYPGIRAFGGKEMSVILNTDRVSPESLGKIPDSIHAYSFVPQLEVLQHADIFLTHCGMNSVNEAMRCGVPMVAMPFINDQIANAKQIVKLGIGKGVRSFPSSGRELYGTVKAVWGDEQMRSRSAQVQQSLKMKCRSKKLSTESDSCSDTKNGSDG